MEGDCSTSLKDLQRELATLALRYSRESSAAAFLIPTDAANVCVAFGTREQITELASDEGMTPYVDQGP